MLQIINNAVGFWGAGYGGGCSLTGSWLSWVLWIFIIALIISIVHSLFKNNRDKSENKNDSALEILRQEYAKGKISKEEYEERKQVLEDG
jgi:putative membrane protein